MAVEIIAEVGVNHNNDLDMTARLVDAAKAAGATVVKFQASTVVEEVSLKGAPDHFADLGKLVPTWGFLSRCKEITEASGLEFLCTPAGDESLDFVVKLGVKRLKVASDNLNNPPFLRAVAKTGLPLILSTGMAASILEVDKARSILRDAGHAGRLAWLHCVSAYPAPVETLNLRLIPSLRPYGQPGYSDHSGAYGVPAVAVACGAELVEVHLTLAKDLPGPDHAASLTPVEFALMARTVREVEGLLGDGLRKAQPVEDTGRRLYRKSIVAKVPIKAGEALTPENITTKRPGTGISADRWDEVMGKKAQRSYEPDDLLGVP